MSGKPGDASVELVSGILTGGDASDQLRGRIESLANKALAEMEYIMEYGNPEMKLVLYRSLLPALIKALNKKEENDEILQLRTQMTDLLEEVRRDKGSEEEVPDAMVPSDDPEFRRNNITNFPRPKP